MQIIAGGGRREIFGGEVGVSLAGGSRRYLRG